ncbi:MAG TPA: hypothetical protein VLI05_03440 [Candidatus Saccharimonadia bacterium]|nr:hypothetical protein [Candidatus Saccharimonadia bacterium]
MDDQSLTVAVWKQYAGGRWSYDPRLSGQPIYRLPAIQAGVKLLGAPVVCLIDTLDWQTLFGNARLAELFGYEQAAQVSLDPDRRRGDLWRVGLTVLHNGAVTSYEPVWIHDRYCLRLRLRVGSRPAELIVPYLTSFSGADRSCEMEQLLMAAELERGDPAFVMGDLNTQRPGQLWLPSSWQRRWQESRLFKPSPRLQQSAWTELIQQLDTRAISLLRQAGLRDLLASDRGPTKVRRVGGVTLKFAVDGCWGGNLAGLQCGAEVLRWLDFLRASDHYPLKLTLSLAQPHLDLPGSLY